MKGLKALKDLYETMPFVFEESNSNMSCLETIEKELKALEIIKEKVSIDLLEELNDDEPYWLDIECSRAISKEEYDLLKEIMK